MPAVEKLSSGGDSLSKIIHIAAYDDTSVPWGAKLADTGVVVWFNPPPLIELVGIVGMSASAVGVGMVRHREGRIALAIGLTLVSCAALLGGFS